jgi:hypothetical protein
MCATPHIARQAAIVVTVLGVPERHTFAEATGKHFQLFGRAGRRLGRNELVGLNRGKILVVTDFLNGFKYIEHRRQTLQTAAWREHDCHNSGPTVKQIAGKSSLDHLAQINHGQWD